MLEEYTPLFIKARDTKKTIRCIYVKYMPLFTCARDTQKTQLIKIKDIPFYGHFKFIKAQFKRMNIMYT